VGNEVGEGGGARLGKEECNEEGPRAEFEPFGGETFRREIEDEGKEKVSDRPPLLMLPGGPTGNIL
jgi:hypothetical protein